MACILRVLKGLSKYTLKSPKQIQFRITEVSVKVDGYEIDLFCLIELFCYVPQETSKRFGSCQVNKTLRVLSTTTNLWGYP